MKFDHIFAIKPEYLTKINKKSSKSYESIVKITNYQLKSHDINCTIVFN